MILAIGFFLHFTTRVRIDNMPFRNDSNRGTSMLEKKQTDPNSLVRESRPLRRTNQPGIEHARSARRLPAEAGL
jgi:hypothetical protein